MITGYVSLKTIIAKLYRDLAINYELNEGDIIEWTAEALKMIGAYGQYDEVSHCLELTNGKAKLPCDFYKLVDINWQGRPMHWATNTNAMNYQCSNCSIPVCDCCDLSFYINDNYLISNINTDTTADICMVYLASPVDDEGYPMVPEDVYYHKAIAAYITYIMDYATWRKGRISDKILAKSEKEWLFYVNSARGSANMPNTAQTENIKNIWQRIMPNPGAYDRNFLGFNRKERRRLK